MGGGLRDAESERSFRTMRRVRDNLGWVPEAFGRLAFRHDDELAALCWEELLLVLLLADDIAPPFTPADELVEWRQCIVSSLGVLLCVDSVDSIRIIAAVFDMVLIRL